MEGFSCGNLIGNLVQMASETPSKTDVMTDFLTGITGHQLWRVQGNEVPGVSPQRRVSVGSDSQMSRVQEQESVPLNSPEIIENRSHCAVGEDGLHQPLATGVESLSVLGEAANNVGQDLIDLPTFPMLQRDCVWKKKIIFYREHFLHVVH